MSLDTLFESMKTATGSNSGVFFTEGVYKVTLKEIEYIPAGYRGKSCKFHFTVDESNNPEHPVGSTRVWITKLDKTPEENKKTTADIKNLVFALLGTTAKEVGSPEANPNAHIQAAALWAGACEPHKAPKLGVDPEALLKRQARLEALKVPTKPKTPGGPAGEYTRHAWSPVGS